MQDSKFSAKAFRDRLNLQYKDDFFVLGAITRHYIAIRIDEEGIKTHITRQQTLLTIDVVDQAI